MPEKLLDVLTASASAHHPHAGHKLKGLALLNGEHSEAAAAPSWALEGAELADPNFALFLGGT
jgi:hypothetical protein